MMSTTFFEKNQNTEKSIKEAKDLLIQRFMEKIDSASDAQISDAIKLEGDKSLIVIVKNPVTVIENKLSARARNQIAFSKLKAKSFDIAKETYDFIESSDVCEILSISKQALSKKIKAGQVIAYTNNRRKYYPDFQFKNNKVNAEISLLIKELNIDPADEPMVNVLIGFLAQTMDFYGDSEKEQPRYKLIDNEDAFKIVVRDFHNRLEMGK